MSSTGEPDCELDSLIAELTIDCYGEHEALSAFENAFDQDARFPLRGSVVGEDVEVLSVAVNDGRRELIATCTRAGRRYEVALLDISIHADPPVSRLLAAYHHWLA